MNLFVSFLLAALVALFQNVFLSSFQLQAFAPFFAFLILQSSFAKSLWGGIFAGVFIDLFSTTQMGFFAFLYFFTICIMFFSKKYFDVNKVHHVVFLTVLISIAITIFHAAGFFLFDRISFLTGKWIFIDLLVLPMLDGLYGLTFFYLPVKAFETFRWNIKKVLLRRK